MNAPPDLPDPGALLRDLVRIPSPSGDEVRAAQFCLDLCAAHGIEAERVGDSVLVRMSRGPGPTVFLNSHLDTVPIGNGWTVEPLDVEWADGRLFGRGANDAKASVVAMLWTALGLARNDAWRGTLLVGLTACEETTNKGMGELLAHLGPDVALDAAVTGEPTGLAVCRAQSGLAVLRAEWDGRSCHAAHVARSEHTNALLVAARELGNTAPYIELEGRHALLGPSTVTATVMHSGERHNVVPDQAEVLFDGRLAPPHDSAEVVAELARRMPSARIGVKSDRLRPVETPEDHALVTAALACSGNQAAVGSATMSDMALLAGVPAIKCGPGQTIRSHTPDEFVLRTELDAGCAFYASLVPTLFEVLQPTTVNR